MKRLIVGVISAVATAYAIRKAGKPEAQEPKAKVPKFSVGDQVLTISPFTGEYVYVDFDGTPLFYEIDKVKWCEPDGNFRYWIDLEGEWIAESWLQKPEYPPMTMTHEDDYDEDTGTITMTLGFEDGEIVVSSTEKKKEAPKMGGHRALEKSELARRKAWSIRMDELMDEYNEYLQAGDSEAADTTLRTYKREQALFNAGSLIREIGGELGGVEPEYVEKEGESE